MAKKFQIATIAIMLGSVLGLTACGGVGSSTTKATPTKLLSVKSSLDDVAKSLAGDWISCDAFGNDGFGAIAKIQPATGEWSVNASPVGFLVYPEKDCKGESKPHQAKDSDEQSILNMYANWQAKFESVTSQDGKVLVEGVAHLNSFDSNFNPIKVKEKVTFTISADGNVLSFTDETNGMPYLFKRLPKK